MARPKLTATVSERLMSNIDKASSGCWNWVGARKSSGYGTITIDGRTKVASRVSFEEYIGPIPDGMHVLHRCDNPPCVNPEHLFLGTPADNVADMIAKGRQAKPNRDTKNSGIGNGRAKLTEADIEAIRSTTRTIQRELAKKYGVSRTQIANIRSRKNWANVP